MATRLILILLVTFVCGVQAQGPLTHDDKVDKISSAAMALAEVAKTFVNVHTDIKTQADETEGEVSAMSDSNTRMSYEVDVMDIEHKIMLAEAAKRTDVTPQEAEDARKRGEAIESAKSDVKELTEKVKTTKVEVDEVNERMNTISLSDEDLQKLQEDANAKVEHGQDHITIPKASEIKTKVDAELAKIQEVIDTVSDATVKTAAATLKTEISSRFADLLGGDTSKNLQHLSMVAKEIDARLVQLKQLDIYGSSSRMEL